MEELQKLTVDSVSLACMLTTHLLTVKLAVCGLTLLAAEH